MINLDSRNILSRWFVWSCDHLPLTVKRVYADGDSQGTRRTGASYVEGGTTLCHVFWVALWVPVLTAALCSLVVLILVVIHVGVHTDFMAAHRDAGPLVSLAAYFIPEGFVLLAAVVSGAGILAVLGGARTGFFSLLWQYLKGIKQRVCPLVRFDG